MDKFVIEGGYPLSGTVVPAGNKNAALPILAASLLTDEELVVGNVPRIRDVESMLALLEDLGVSVIWRDDHEVALRASLDHGRRRRRRAGRAASGPRSCWPGRCSRAPARPASRRRAATSSGGAGSTRTSTRCARSARRCTSIARTRCGRRTACAACDLFMDEASVMATENTLMAAALTQGTTTIRNAASEPHVQNLARLLRADGRARSTASAPTCSPCTACGGCAAPSIDIAPDHIEVGSFMALAAVTGGELRIKDTMPEDLKMIRMVFERLGLKSHLDGADLIVPPEQRLRVRDDVGGRDPRRSTTARGRPSRPT